MKKKQFHILVGAFKGQVFIFFKQIKWLWNMF